jgi:hypothetical protein
MSNPNGGCGMPIHLVKMKMCENQFFEKSGWFQFHFLCLGSYVWQQMLLILGDECLKVAWFCIV